MKRKNEDNDIRVDIESTPTSGCTSTDADSITEVFGQDSPYLKLIDNSDKTYCPICKKLVKKRDDKCSECGHKLN